MSRRTFRVVLVIGYGLLVVGMVAAIAAFIEHSNRHVGADYAAAASNIVRGQHEASTLGHAVNAYYRDPSPEARDRILRILETVESREGTTRNSFERLDLDAQTQASIVGEFDQVLGLLPRLAQLTEQALDDSEAREAFRALGMEVEDSLAFVYSRLHRYNMDAAAQQQRFTRWLGIVVIGLAALLLVIIAALLWTVDKVFGQKQTFEHLTMTDMLTELPNRRGMLERFEHLLPLHRRKGEPLSLALFDFDHFKSINDRDGHPVGDAVLQFVSREIADCIRDSDMLARVGGEEFGLLLPATDRDGAYRLCERIRRHVESLELPMAGSVRNLTISVGVASDNVDEGTGFESLYIRADDALYRAKREGRNRVVVDA